MQPQTPNSPPSQNSLTEILQRCFDLGYGDACKARALESNTSVLESLEGRAAAFITGAHRPAFAPDTDHFDQLTLKEMEELEHERQGRKVELDFASAEARKRRDEQAACGATIAPPRVSATLRYGTAFGLAISISPTIHDLMFGIPDPVIKWVLALIGGAVIGIVIVDSILPNQPEEVRK